MCTERLPFFVYGTLRPGEGNYSWALEGKTSREATAVLDGATMYGTRGFPYVILTPGERQVTGTLCFVRDEEYEETLAALDFLEGYRGPGENNHYDRVVRTVVTEDGESVQAYVYVASENHAESVRASQPVIECGDWLKHLAADLKKVHSGTDNWWETYR